MKPLEKEAQIREMLGKEFGTIFRKTQLPLTDVKFHKFDAVSSDHKIIAEVKDYIHTDKAYKNTRFPRVMLDCRYLEMVNAERRFLVLTNREFYEHFIFDSRGLLFKNIEMRLIEI